MSGSCIPSGELLLAVAALVSIQMSQGRSTDEIALLAAFFTALGDNLALIATRHGIASEAKNDCKGSVKSIDIPGGSV